MAKGANSKLSPARLAARDKQTRAVELRILGWTLQRIADEVGYASEGATHKAIEAGLARREKPAAEELAKVHMARLELAAEPIMAKLTRHLEGDPLSTRALSQATLALVRVLSQQARYVDVYSQGQGLGPVVSLLEQLLTTVPAGADPDDPMTIDATPLEIEP